MVLQLRHSTRRRNRRSILLFIVACALILLFISTRESQNTEELEKQRQDAEERRLLEHKMREAIDVRGWLQNPVVGCQGNFQGYGEEFVRLQHARVNTWSGKFYIPCDSDIPKYDFQYGAEGTPLKGWLENMMQFPLTSVKTLDVIETTAIAIWRIEAHNLYHTMCEWYNVFILSKLLNFNPSEVQILFMDERPPGNMDETWNTLFKTVTKYTKVENNKAFKELLWNVIGYESPMNHHYIKRTIPYLREFRDFFLSAFNIQETKTLNCDHLTVTVILRRDYMTHPERLNMTGGLVHRKFQNEDEILREVKIVFSNAKINGIIMEQLSMREQLNIITNTDVLIGMHGAAMTHVLFLPRHAGVFEMFPKYWGFYHHFKAIARWRNLRYSGWQNTMEENEYEDFYTRIPPDVVRFHCSNVKFDLCGK